MSPVDSAPRIVLAGHGSRSDRGYEEFDAFVKLFAERFPGVNFRHGYLEFNQPTIEEAVKEIARDQGGPIIVVPAILGGGKHVKNDLPAIMKNLREQLPNEDIRFASVLNLHPKNYSCAANTSPQPKLRATKTYSAKKLAWWSSAEVLRIPMPTVRSLS